MSATNNGDDATDNCVLELDNILHTVCTKMRADTLLISLHFNRTFAAVTVRTYIITIPAMQQVGLVRTNIDTVPIPFIEGNVVRVPLFVFPLKSKVAVCREEKGEFMTFKSFESVGF